MQLVQRFVWILWLELVFFKYEKLIDGLDQSSESERRM